MHQLLAARKTEAFHYTQSLPILILQATLMISPKDILSAVVILLYAISLVAVSLRLISQKLAYLELWWDDRIILLAFVRSYQSIRSERYLGGEYLVLIHEGPSYRARYLPSGR